MTHGALAVLSLLLVPNTPNVKLLPNGVFAPVSVADLRRKQARRLQLKNLLYNPDYDGCDLTDKTAWPHSWERGDERKVLRAKVTKYYSNRTRALCPCARDMSAALLSRARLTTLSGRIFNSRAPRDGHRGHLPGSQRDHIIEEAEAPSARRRCDGV